MSETKPRKGNENIEILSQVIEDIMKHKVEVLKMTSARDGINGRLRPGNETSDLQSLQWNCPKQTQRGK